MYRTVLLRHTLVLHSDNGRPMKGATRLATLQWLGVAPSFCRPRVSDEIAFSKALSRTLRQRAFTSIDEARRWVARFMAWDNTGHRHCGSHFVTPEHRHLAARLRCLPGAAKCTSAP